MNTRSKILIGLCLVAAMAFPAIADITYTQGSGTTIFDFTCFTTKHCSAHVPINSSGTEIAVATAAKQPALGTAGSASADVITVQGVASMTPLFMQSATVPVVTMNSANANSGVNSALAGVFDDVAPTAITENSFGFLRMSTNRNLYGTIRDAAGNERGANVNASGQLAIAGPVTAVSGGIAAGALATGAGVDGWDLTQGAIADAAVTAGATGSLSAKLRAISRDIGTLTTLFNANGRATSAFSSPTVPAAAPTTWHLIAANSTNATSVKGSAATLFSCQLGNIDSTAVYLKIYNKATAPTVGSDTPVKTLIIPKAGTAADGAGNTIFFGPGGLALGTGFAAAVTAGITVADTTAVAASKVAINCDYE